MIMRCSPIIAVGRWTVADIRREGDFVTKAGKSIRSKGEFSLQNRRNDYRIHVDGRAVFRVVDHVGDDELTTLLKLDGIQLFKTDREYQTRIRAVAYFPAIKRIAFEVGFGFALVSKFTALQYVVFAFCNGPFLHLDSETTDGSCRAWAIVILRGYSKGIEYVARLANAGLPAEFSFLFAVFGVLDFKCSSGNTAVPAHLNGIRSGLVRSKLFIRTIHGEA